MQAPAVVSTGSERLAAFFREADGSLGSWRITEGRWKYWNLGGEISSAPSAVAMERDQIIVVARGTDDQLLAWYLYGDMLFGPTAHSRWLTADPVAFADGPNGYFVMSESLNGPLRLWHGAGGVTLNPVDYLDAWGGGAPAGVARVPGQLLSGEFDLVSRKYNGTLLRHVYLGAEQRWAGPDERDGQITGRPAAASWGPHRLDVVARDEAGRFWHFGWDGGRWFPTENNAAGPLVADPSMVAWGPHRLDAFARGPNATLQQWWWDAPARQWRGPVDLYDGLVSDPVAISRGPDRLDVVFWTDGALVHWAWNGQNWEATRLARPEGDEISAEPVRRPASEADFLLARPDDLVMMGVRFSGFVLAEREGRLPALRAAYDEARVSLVLPPQHVAEQVNPQAGTARARLSGPSRLTFGLTDGEGTLALPNVEYILNLCSGQVALPITPENPQGTSVELPFRFRTTLDSAYDNDEVMSAHTDVPEESKAGVVGLWRTRLTAIERLQAITDAGLVLRPVDIELAAAADPFRMPLGRAHRRTISQLGAPAQAQNLELSALGGWLSAGQVWPSFAWEHRTTLGRDQKVRTAVDGVLFPLNLRAKYVELTERVFTVVAGRPVAALRMTTLLTITESVMRPPATEPERRAFPFHEVAATASIFPDIDEPAWIPYTRPSLTLDGLEQMREQMRQEFRRLEVEVYGGDMGWNGGPVVEELAETVPAAADLLGYHASLVEIDQRMAELRQDTSSRDVDLCFWPTVDGGKPLNFPVRFGDVHVDLPMMFVADHEFPATAGCPSFEALADPKVLELLQQEHQRHGNIVDLPGVPLTVVKGQWTKAGDVHEVHRLNLAGVSTVHGYGFVPRLGPDSSAPGPYEPWAFEVELPALRTLLGQGRRTALTYTDAFLQQGEAIDVALKVARPADVIDISFVSNAGRSGALVAPQLVADGISRLHGPVQIAGWPDPAPEVPVALDPAAVLGEAATLLGMNLAEMIGTVTEPPAIVSELDRRPPVVRMQWREVKLTSHRPFVAGPGATLTLEVESTAQRTRTHCEITDFALVLPPDADLEDPLLRLDFRALRFTQETGDRPEPKLEVDGLDLTFGGPLKLLEGLRELVDLTKAGLRVDVSGTEIAAHYTLPIPAAKAGVFVMSGIAFHAGVRVPFHGSPVVSLGFASRAEPFNLSVLMFGGGGYLELEIDNTGVRRLEASLEFGAMVAVDFVVARGEVHALGGVRYVMVGKDVKLTGYIRFGGSVEVLGLIAVSVELLVELTYQAEGARLTGRATLVLEIDLTLISESVELDSGEWELAGGDSHAAAPPTTFLAAADPWPETWAAYRACFAKEVLP